MAVRRIARPCENQTVLTEVCAVPVHSGQRGSGSCLTVEAAYGQYVPVRITFSRPMADAEVAIRRS